MRENGWENGWDFGASFWLRVRVIFKRRTAKGHNLLGVAPAIQKLRLRAILTTAPFLYIIA